MKPRDEVILDKHLTDQDVSNSIWGFHAQQSVEKILKAVLTKNGILFPKTHDLTVLIGKLDENGIKLPVAEEELDWLTPFAVAFRYDDESDLPLDRTHARAITLKVRKWAEQICA